jgi:hypothetical protein
MEKKKLASTSPCDARAIVQWTSLMYTVYCILSVNALLLTLMYTVYYPLMHFC